MERGFVNLAVEKPKRARSVMWYVDFLVAIGVIGIVVALVLINFALV
ncbi:hypothetical protein [Kaarinaea lacus]